MSLPNNRRIFDMGRGAWQYRTEAMEMPTEPVPVWHYQRPYKLLFAARELLCEGQRFVVGYDAGTPSGDHSTVVTMSQWSQNNAVVTNIETPRIETEQERQNVTRQIEESIIRAIEDSARGSGVWGTVASPLPSVPEESAPPRPPRTHESLEAQAERIAGAPARVYGHYLCEFCFAEMTDQVVPADQAPLGVEMAWCGCQEGEVDR